MLLHVPLPQAAFLDLAGLVAEAQPGGREPEARVSGRSRRPGGPRSTAGGHRLPWRGVAPGGQGAPGRQKEPQAMTANSSSPTPAPAPPSRVPRPGRDAHADARHPPGRGDAPGAGDGGGPAPDRVGDGQRRAEPPRLQGLHHHRPHPLDPGGVGGGPGPDPAVPAQAGRRLRRRRVRCPGAPAAPPRALSGRRGGCGGGGRPGGADLWRLRGDDDDLLQGRGGAGVVVDGCLRDIAAIKQLGLGLWLRGATPNFHTQTVQFPARSTSPSPAAGPWCCRAT